MPPPQTRLREHKQCQTCYKDDNPPKFMLKSCQKCSRAHYCNRECQTADWPSHKRICKLQAECGERIRASSAQAALDTTGATIDPKIVANKLKQWVRVYRPVIDRALINALTLHITPDRCLDEMLYITLKETSHEDITRYFTIETTSFCPFAEAKVQYVRTFGPGQDELLAVLLDRSHKIRAGGGIGVAVAMLYIEEAGILHLNPTVVQDLVPFAPRDSQWSASLKRIVAAGKIV